MIVLYNTDARLDTSAILFLQNLKLLLFVPFSYWLKAFVKAWTAFPYLFLKGVSIAVMQIIL